MAARVRSTPAFAACPIVLWKLLVVRTIGVYIKLGTPNWQRRQRRRRWQRRLPTGLLARPGLKIHEALLFLFSSLVRPPYVCIQ